MESHSGDHKSTITTTTSASKEDDDIIFRAEFTGLMSKLTQIHQENVTKIKERELLSKRMKASNIEIQELRQQMQQATTTAPTALTTTMPATPVMPAADKHARHNRVHTLEIQVKALNTGFQGLNEACSEADVKTTTLALTVLCCFARKCHQARIRRAWRCWEKHNDQQKLLLSHSSRDAISRLQIDMETLQQKHRTLKFQHESLLHQHGGKEDQVQDLKQQQQTMEDRMMKEKKKGKARERKKEIEMEIFHDKHRGMKMAAEDLESELNQEIHRHAATREAFEQWKQREQRVKEAATEAATNAQPLTVIVEEHVDRSLLLEKFENVSIDTELEMEAMQRSVDHMSQRLQQVNNNVHRLEEHRRDFHVTKSAAVLCEVVRSTVLLRRAVRRSFGKWRDRIELARHREELKHSCTQAEKERTKSVVTASALATMREMRKEDKNLLDEKIRELDARDTRSALDELTEMDVAHEELKRVREMLESERKEGERRRREHEHQIQMLRSRVVAAQQEFDRRSEEMERERRRERHDFEQERKKLRLESRGREVAWRRTAKEATGLARELEQRTR